MRIPLGREEGQQLEFKARDALAKPAGIVRGVVAMLNASGGEIWIGLGESSGRAVEVQPIVALESERERLWNHLVDTIEPAPTGDELTLTPVPAEGGHVLCIQTRPRRRPYAQLKEGGRHYVVRIGARTRPMTREEILTGSQASSRSRARHGRDPREILEKERDAILRSRQPTLWVRFEPERDLGIDIQSDRIGRYLREPSLSGNRESGWTFANAYLPVRLERGRRILGDEESGFTSVARSGAIEHRTPLHWLTHSIHPSTEIYPYALLEKTVSLFRLAGMMYQDSELTRESGFGVMVGFAIAAAKGWRLRAYSPRSSAWMLGHHEVRGFEHLRGELSRDVLLQRPLEFRSEELCESPDACAFRLIRYTYEEFGLTEDMIPSEFDRARGVLVMPE